MKKTVALIGSSLLCTLLASCTHQAAYKTLQTSGRSHAACEAIQDNAESARCEADFEKPYAEYERERRQVLSQQSDESH